MIENFHKPETIREALGLKRKLQGRAVFLAGGTYLNSNEYPLHPEHCISLGGLGLDRIDHKKNEVALGALCTLQQLLEDARVPPPLKAAVAQVVNRNVRNAATIGGHVASNLRHSDVIPALVALDARIALSGSGASKTMSVADYTKKRTPGLITRIIIPRPGPGRVFACRNARASANARSLVTAAVSVTLGRTSLANPVVALGGITPRVVRLAAVEKELDGKPLPALDELQAIVARSVKPASDPFGSAAFRKYEAAAVVALTLHDACRRSGGRT